MMLVSGVRRSWDTARSRLARSFSFSASMIRSSSSLIRLACSFRRKVVALVRMEIKYMKRKVSGYPDTAKLNTKKG